MNAKRMMPPLLMALAVSSVCTFALSRKMSHRSDPVAMVGYVVPTHAYAAGDMLRPDGVQVAQWPADRPVAGAFLKTSDVVGRSLLYPVDANQPLTDKLLSAPGAGTGLAARIPEGMRAIALRSDEVMGVAGFVTPGSHLDVLVTYRTDRLPEPRTVTVLQNAEVLAAGQQVQPDPQGKPSTVNVVTLLLAPQDAERAVLASTQGTIHFVMRSGADHTEAHDKGVTLAQLADPNAPMPVEIPAPVAAAPVPVKPAAPAAPPKLVRQSTVEIFSGDKQTTASFPDGGK